MCVCVFGFVFSDYCYRNNGKKENVTGAQILVMDEGADVQLKDFLKLSVAK